MSKDIGIDLGTSSVLVYVKDKGIVLREPSVVAIDKNTNRILKVGSEAQIMLGRTPGNIIAVRPLRDGVISQYEITLRMIQYFIKKACGTMLFKPRVIICVPSGINEVEERAVIDAGINAGAKRTYLIEEPVAAAIGAGINISGPNGSMVVDIGGGTTDIAVLSLGGVVVSESIKIAGNRFDDAIIRYVKKMQNVLIGENTAERIKIRIGQAAPSETYIRNTGKLSYSNTNPVLQEKGRCLITGLPKMVEISSSDTSRALEGPVNAIIEAVCSVIERTPPELIDDILRNGIVMTGGGSLLHGLSSRIAEETEIKVRIAKNPISCVAIGTGKSLENITSMRNTITSRYYD